MWAKYYCICHMFPQALGENVQCLEISEFHVSPILLFVDSIMLQ